MINSIEFGKKILSLRKNKKYTQEKMSGFLNVTPQAVSKWEKGESLPDIGVLPLLAQVLGVSIDYLLTSELRLEKNSPYDDQYEKEEYYWGKNASLLAKHIVSSVGNITNRNLLDIGSGEGRDAVFFSKNGFDVDALEISAPGIEKIKKYSKESNCNVNILHEDMLDYKLTKNYGVIYSSGSLQFLPLDQRQRHFEHYKKHTSRGGINAHLVFVEKPFIKTAPDWEENEFFYVSGDLARYYADWEILYYGEKIIDCDSSGIDHQHVICSIVAQNR